MEIEKEKASRSINVLLDTVMFKKGQRKCHKTCANIAYMYKFMCITL